MTTSPPLEMAPEGLRLDPSDLAGIEMVDAAEDTHRPAHDEVAPHRADSGPGHGGGIGSLGQGRLEVESQSPDLRHQGGEICGGDHGLGGDGSGGGNQWRGFF